MKSKFSYASLIAFGAMFALIAFSNGARADTPPPNNGCPPFCEGPQGASIGFVNINNMKTDAGVEAQYDFSIQVAKTIASGKKLQFVFKKKDGSCDNADCRPGFANSTFSSTANPPMSSAISGTYTTKTNAASETYGELTLSSELTMGFYNFSLSKVVNPKTTTEFLWAISVDWTGAGTPTDVMNSSSFAIFGQDFFNKPPESGCPPYCEGDKEDFQQPGDDHGPANPGQDLTKRINLQGKVVDPNGNPIKGASVDAASSDFRSFYYDMTTETGEYAIRGMAIGTYVVKVQAPFGTGGLIAPADTTITLASESDLKILNLAFSQATKTIKGSVKDGSGKAVKNVNVNAFQFANGNFQNTQTDEKGLYVLGVSAGEWEVNIEPGFMQFGSSDFKAPDWIYTGTPKFASFNAEGTVAEEAVLDWVVDRTSSFIKGQFVDSSGKGLEGFVEIRSEKFASNVGTDSEGKFSVGAPQGRVSLTFFPNDASISFFETKLEVPGTGEVDIGKVALAGKESAITGTVVDTNGNPVEGVNVNAFSGGFGSKFEEFSGGPGIPPGPGGKNEGPGGPGDKKFTVKKLNKPFTALGMPQKGDEKFEFKEGEQFKGDFDFDAGQGFELPEGCTAPGEGGGSKEAEKKSPEKGKFSTSAFTGDEKKEFDDDKEFKDPGKNHPNQPDSQPKGQPNNGNEPKGGEQPMCPDTEFIGEFSGGPMNFGFGSATTNDKGAFTIAANAGDYMVDIAFGPESNVVPSSGPKSVTVGSKESVDVGEITVQIADAKISVTVVDANGAAYTKGFGFANCSVAGEFGPGSFFGNPLVNGKAVVSVVSDKKYSCSADLGGKDTNVSIDESKFATPKENETVLVQLTAVPDDASVKFTIKDQKGKVVTSPVEFFAMGIGEGNFSHRGTRSETGEGTLTLRGGKQYSFGLFIDNFGGKKTYMHTPPDPEPQTVPKNGTLKYTKTVFEADSSITVRVQNPDGSAAPFAFVFVNQFHLVDQGKIKPGEALESGSPTNSKGEAHIPVAGGREYSIGVGIDPAQAELGYMMPAEELATVPVSRGITKTIKYKSADANISGGAKFENGTKATFGFCRAFSKKGGNFSGGELRDSKYSINVTSGDGPWVVNCNTHLPGLGYYESADVSVETPTKGKYSTDLTLVAGGFEVPEAMTTTINGQSAANIKLPDGGELKISAGAISQDESITLTITPNVNLLKNDEIEPLAYGYDFTAVASGKEIEEFDSNVTLSFKYTDKMLEAAGVEDESTLKMKYLDDSTTTWKTTDAATVDTKKNLITAQVDHFSTFASLSEGGSKGKVVSSNIDGDSTKTPKGGALLATTAKGQTSKIQLIDVKGKVKKSWYLFGEKTSGNFEVVGADIDGDGLRDYIAFPSQTGMGPQVRAFNGKGQLLGSVFVYDQSDRGGLQVAAGDFDDDGIDELAVARFSGTSEVVLLDYNSKKKTFSQLDSKAAFSASEKWGWYLDSGDVNEDGVDDVVISKRKGGDSKAAVLTYDTKKKDLKQLFTYDVYGAGFAGGMLTQVGDVDGDGKEEAVHVPENGAVNVQIFGANKANKKMTKEASGLAFAETFKAGARLEVGEVTGDGNSDIVVLPGSGGGSNLRVYSIVKGKMKLHSWLMVYDSSLKDGASVTAVDMLTGDNDKEVVVAPYGEQPANTRIYDFTTESLSKKKKPDLVKGFYAYPSTSKVHTNLSW